MPATAQRSGHTGTHAVRFRSMFNGSRPEFVQTHGRWRNGSEFRKPCRRYHVQRIRKRATVQRHDKRHGWRRFECATLKVFCSTFHILECVRLRSFCGVCVRVPVRPCNAVRSERVKWHKPNDYTQTHGTAHRRRVCVPCLPFYVFSTNVQSHAP